MTENLINRISFYLASGGLFNPELADHIAVRTLLFECREALAQRTWVGLTDEEVNTIYEQAEVLVNDSWVGNGTVGLMFPVTLYKMFEAKLKEKNGL